MSEPTKRPVWPFLTAVLIGLPVLYVASFGPAVWLCNYAVDRDRLDPEGLTVDGLRVFYAPMQSIIDSGPEPVAKALDWYARLFL